MPLTPLGQGTKRCGVDTLEKKEHKGTGNSTEDAVTGNSTEDAVIWFDFALMPAAA
jgi:hypothetical protein